MFLKYLEPIFVPFRKMRNKIVKVRTVKGNIKAEKNRVQRFGNVAKYETKRAKGFANKAQAHANKAQGQAAQVQGQVPGQQAQVQAPQAPQGFPPQQMPQQMPQQPQYPGMPQGVPMHGQQPGAQPGGLNPNPPIKIVGFFRRRKICTQCNTQLDKTWDSCPYCAQAAAAQAPAASAKTQAFMIGGGGGGGADTMQLLGWLVPLKGAQRGELFTLAPQSVIGTEPTCTVVLTDNYMSSRHAEIVAQGGVWVLRDLGSTNGTKVNDKPVSQHELVDNDIVMFGQSPVKFKSL